MRNLTFPELAYDGCHKDHLQTYPLGPDHVVSSNLATQWYFYRINTNQIVNSSKQVVDRLPYMGKAHNNYSTAHHQWYWHHNKYQNYHFNLHD